MKKLLVFLLLSCLLCASLFAESFAEPPVKSPASNAPNPISIVHPFEKEEIPALEETFVYGSAPVGGELKINGEPVQVHPGGGFVAMVNLRPGEFQINAELQLGGEIYHFTRTIIVAEREKAAPVVPLTIEYVTPRRDRELLPGDYVEVVCKGSPGAKAYFTVEGVRGRFPMTESETVPAGIYHGVYRVGDRDRLKESKIKVTLVNEKRRRTTLESEGVLSLFPDDLPVMAEVISPRTVLRAGPALTSEQAGYLLYPPVGTLLRVTGRIGGEYRVNLTKNKTVWVNADQVKRLPEGTLPAHVPVSSVSFSETADSTKIHIPLKRKIPFQLLPDMEENYIDLILFGAFSNTDWITNLATGVIKSVSWFQDEDEVYRLRIKTKPDSWWGYDARYEGNVLVLELRTPPPLPADASPLAGLTIAVDAGHGAGGGAIGPTGYAEGDANFAQAVDLKEKLLAKGAKVVMVREGQDDLPLSARTKLAWEKRADILISLHNNGLDYSGNPFLKHGFGVYYFTPMSLPPAKEIHAAYSETFRTGGEYNLPDDGLHYANLAMTRNPQMPSVLVESAYMTLPAEEAFLKTDTFRSACSNAIISGLERYARRMRQSIL